MTYHRMSDKIDVSIEERRGIFERFVQNVRSILDRTGSARLDRQCTSNMSR